MASGNSYGSIGGDGRARCRDARVPCPLCGGLIHPVAGRCKHCKQDLSRAASRSARRGDAAARAAAGAGLARPSRCRSHVKHAVAADLAAAPDRHAHRRAAAVARRRLRGRSWPMLVIVLAVAAIVGAVVIMVWPEHHGAGEHPLKPPPAPERMDTDPLPPPRAGIHGVDPWSNGPTTRRTARSCRGRRPIRCRPSLRSSPTTISSASATSCPAWHRRRRRQPGLHVRGDGPRVQQAQDVPERRRHAASRSATCTRSSRRARRPRTARRPSAASRRSTT